jgi:hypothetical protein
MIQNLLADRFKLKFHFEKKDVPAYNLVLAKNGPKMQESAGPVTTGDKQMETDPRKTDADGFAVLPPGRSRMMTIISGAGGTRAAADAPGPTIFQALQEQLGLKLEPAKATVDILVIDHMEKTPTEN